jgi:hypothetical protein
MRKAIYKEVQGTCHFIVTKISTLFCENYRKLVIEPSQSAKRVFSRADFAAFTFHNVFHKPTDPCT